MFSLIVYTQIYYKQIETAYIATSPDPYPYPQYCLSDGNKLKESCEVTFSNIEGSPSRALFR